MINELYMLFQRTRDWLGPILIFTMIMIAFPLSLNIYSADLISSFESVLVISLLMIAFISSDGMFNEDFLDGSFEMLISEGGSIFQTVFEKLCASFLLISFPIALAGLLFSIANGAINQNYMIAFLGIFFVNMILNSIFAFGSAISLNKGAILGVISVLPFSMPAIILFGRFLDSISSNISSINLLQLLGGISIITFLVFSWLCSKIIKLHIE
ncbi:MAG: heme exporter protein CcmB [Gammaproteobacteria bacterium]